MTFSIFYILFSVLMFLDCVFLVFLVLLQLPKKEAGAGMAFGGAATDALFGAGSGNVLTKVTKYAAGVFFSLALVMAVMASGRSKTAGAALLEEMTKKGAPAMSQTATPPASTTGTTPAVPLLQISNTAPAQTPAKGTNK
ncbi:MAG: preprotein translocase subunit SecG [Limisphaerales bacterium]